MKSRHGPPWITTPQGMWSSPNRHLIHGISKKNRTCHILLIYLPIADPIEIFLLGYPKTRCQGTSSVRITGCSLKQGTSPGQGDKASSKSPLKGYVKFPRRVLLLLFLRWNNNGHFWCYDMYNCKSPINNIQLSNCYRWISSWLMYQCNHSCEWRHLVQTFLRVSFWVSF